MALRNTVVLVLNPVPGRTAYMKLRKAEKLEKKGWLQFSECRRKVKITRFTDDELSAMNGEGMKQRGYDKDTNTVLSNREQVEGLPCIKPVILITNPTVRSIYNRFNRNGRVRIHAKNGIVCLNSTSEAA